MKNILILLFAFVAFQATAQIITEKDSSYIEIIGGIYYETREIVYPSGDMQTNRTKIGTLADVVNKKVSDFTQRADQMAEAARPVSTFKARITEIIREGAAAKLLLGASPMDTLQARRVAPLLVSGWTIKNGTTTSIVFSQTAQGVLRYKLGADANKNAVLLGSIIRLRNYGTTTEDVDLYILDNGNYTDILRRYTLKKPQ